MISEILGEESLDFHPSSILSKAHQAERTADRMVITQDFSSALNYYAKAQQLMEEVLKVADNRHAVESLQKQLEYIKKQPSIIRRKKEDLAWRKRQKSLEQRKKLDQENATNLIETTKDEIDGLNGSSANTRDTQTDSLLACLNDNMVEEDDHGFTYKSSELKEFFNQCSSNSRNSDDNLSTGEEDGDSAKVILVNKLERQNKELMEHICHLFQALNSCEEENKQLKENMKVQEQELETLRSQTMRESVLDLENVELPLPFQSEYFGDSPIASLPSLPPLDLPLNQLQISGYDEEEQREFQEEM